MVRRLSNNIMQS